MKAVVKYAVGPGNVELREVPKPSPGRGEVLVAVKAAGICGSDLHIYHGDIQLLLRTPVVMGHEFTGVIAELGAEVEGLHVGQRVTCETAARTCGHCWACRTGWYNACGQKELLGYIFDGGFAPYCAVPARLIHPLPEGVDFVAGALGEPLACCVHAIGELAGVWAGETVLIAIHEIGSHIIIIIIISRTTIHHEELRYQVHADGDVHGGDVSLETRGLDDYLHLCPVEELFGVDAGGIEL